MREVSLTGVAEKAGLTRGAILYYDDDLEALLLYRGILDRGVAAGVFDLGLGADTVAMTLVALEDSYGLHIVAGNSRIGVELAATAMRSVAGQLGAQPEDAR